MDEFKKKVERIKSIIANMEGKTTAEEIIMEISQILPPLVVNVPLEPKSSPQQLAYMKQWREDRKELLILQAKIGNREAINKIKVAKALKREKIFCFVCKEIVIVDVSLNKSSIETKRGQIKKKIIITNECPHCHNQIRSFGGVLLS